MAFQIDFGAVNQARAGAQQGFQRNLQGLMGLGQQMQAQRTAQQQQQQQQTAVQEGLEALDTNNPQEVARFMTKYPGLAQNIQRAWDFQTDQQKQEGMRAAIGAMQAYDAEGVEGAARVLKERIEQKMERGLPIDKEMRSFQMLQQNPEQFRKSAEVTAYALMDPDEYLKMKEAQRVSPIKREELDLKREALELRKGEAELRRLDQSLSRETNELKRQEIQQRINVKRDEVSTKKREAVQKAEDDIATIDNTISSVDRLIQHPGREAATGVSAGFFTIPGSEAAGFEAQLESFQSQAFLSEVAKMRGMGALSENEGKKLASAVGALRPTMPEKEFLKELERIKSVMEKGRNKMRARMPKEIEEGVRQTFFSPLLNEEIMESDIQETMRTHGVTREQVLRRLGIQ